MSDFIKDNFLPEDHDKADEELTCYRHCKDMSDQYMELNRIDKAAVYSNNATRSLEVLAKLRNKHDQAWFLLKQLDYDRSQIELLQKQMVKVYD
jgi:hypothetical protein